MLKLFYETFEPTTSPADRKAAHKRTDLADTDSSPDMHTGRNRDWGTGGFYFNQQSGDERKMGTNLTGLSNLSPALSWPASTDCYHFYQPPAH